MDRFAWCYSLFDIFTHISLWLSIAAGSKFSYLVKAVNQ